MAFEKTNQRLRSAFTADVVRAGRERTDSSGYIYVEGLKATSAVIVTIAALGNDSVLSHTHIEKGRFRLFLKDASGSSPISSTAGTGIDTSYLAIIE